jgi:hypothetical protein
METQEEMPTCSHESLGESGGILPQNIFEIRSSEMQFPAFWPYKFALKFILTVFEIKEGKAHKK